jgi:outer membrane scaffolding protein for murein synthesis (MipA/OmpV family)
MAADGEASVDAPQNIEELDVTARRQSALDAEAISLSDTPDAEPSVGGKPTIVVGLAARDAPVYDGSKKNKVSPFPYLDIHGIFHDRVFISDIRGIGFNLYTDEAFKAGLAVNYGGRTSSDRVSAPLASPVPAFMRLPNTGDWRLALVSAISWARK